MKKILVFILLLISVSLIGNEKIDEIMKQLENKEGKEKINLYIQLIDSNVDIDPDLSLIIAQNALHYAQLVEDNENEIVITLKIGQSYQNAGNYSEAYDFFTLAKEKSLEIKFDNGYINSLINLAKLCAEISASEKSTNLLFKALDLAYSYNDELLISSILYEIGKNYKNQEEYDLALLYLGSARDKFNDIDQYELKISCNIQIGKTYMNLQNFDLAGVNANQALMDAKKGHFPVLEAIANNDLGWVHLNLGHYEKAIEFNEEARRIREENDYYIFTISSLINIGEVYFRWGKFEKSHESYLLAESKLDPLNNYPSLQFKERLYVLMMQLAAQKKDFEEAFNLHIKLKEINEILSETINSKVIEDLKVLFEIERKGDVRETEQKIIETEIVKQKIIIYALTLIVLLFCSLSVIIFSRYKLRKKMALDLEKKNQILSNLNDKLNSEIKDRKKIETQLDAQKQYLHLINKILRHDLANDIATIKSGISIFRRTKDDKILDEISTRIIKSVKMINNMKKFETFMNLHSNLKPIEVQPILTQIQSNYKEVELVNTKGCKIIADDSFISVIENIVSNAIDHGHASSVKISSQKESDNVYLFIKNDGKQIPELIIDKIFGEGFMFGESANTGMGLYIVKELMGSYGGSVEVENIAEGGVLFTLQFHALI